MFSKAITVVAAASLANQALALGRYHHAHQKAHYAKRDLSTVFETVIDWSTLYVDENGVPYSTAVPSKELTTTTWTTSTTSTTSTISTSTSTTSTTAVPSTTLSTSTLSSTSSTSSIPTTSAAPVTSDPPVVAQTPTTSEAAPVTTQQPEPEPQPQPTSQPTSQPAPIGGARRGLAYNQLSFLSKFIGTGSKVGWAYNWDSLSNGDIMSMGIEFVPMLWSTRADHVNRWTANANKMLAAGAKALLSFNEPDLKEQANLTPQAAADGHIKYMNPFGDRARIGAPAITNGGGANMGIGWLKQFMAACNGQCKVDFLPIHWYAAANTGNYIFRHLLDVHAAFPDKKVWITEFAPDAGTEDEKNAFLKKVVDQLDNNATFSFVERYAYFMVSPGRLLLPSGNELSVAGKTFAFS